MLNQNETSIQEPGVRMLNQNETSIQEPGVRSQNAQPEPRTKNRRILCSFVPMFLCSFVPLFLCSFATYS